MQGAECRATYKEARASAELLDESALAGDAAYGAGRRSRAAEAGGVATLARPTVAEIRASQSGGPPKDDDPIGQTIRATAARIKPLSNFIYRAMQVGVLLVAAGTILGGVWADYSWGRFWGWDNKEVWALITLLVYLVPLHGRFAGWVNTFGLVCLSVACFLSVLMAWYGVNFVLGVGLHSYGFTEGGGQGIVGAISLMVLGFVFAAACAGTSPRRSATSATDPRRANGPRPSGLAGRDGACRAPRRSAPLAGDRLGLDQQVLGPASEAEGAGARGAAGVDLAPDEVDRVGHARDIVQAEDDLGLARRPAAAEAEAQASGM